MAQDATTHRIARRFLALGGRLMIHPDGHPVASIDAAALLSRAVATREGHRVRRINGALNLILDRRALDLCTLIEQHGHDVNGWTVWREDAVLPPPGSVAFRALLDHSDAVRDRFNNLPIDLEMTDEAQHQREMDALCEASRNADRAIPTNWQEYTRLIEHMTDNGHSQIDDDNANRLLAHARRLSKMEA